MCGCRLFIRNVYYFQLGSTLLAQGFQCNTLNNLVKNSSMLHVVGSTRGYPIQTSSGILGSTPHQKHTACCVIQSRSFLSPICFGHFKKKFFVRKKSGKSIISFPRKAFLCSGIFFCTFIFAYFEI